MVWRLTLVLLLCLKSAFTFPHKYKGAETDTHLTDFIVEPRMHHLNIEHGIQDGLEYSEKLLTNLRTQLQSLRNHLKHTKEQHKSNENYPLNIFKGLVKSHLDRYAHKSGDKTVQSPFLFETPSTLYNAHETRTTVKPYFLKKPLSATMNPNPSTEMKENHTSETLPYGALNNVNTLNTNNVKDNSTINPNATNSFSSESPEYTTNVVTQHEEEESYQTSMWTHPTVSKMYITLQSTTGSSVTSAGQNILPDLTLPSESFSRTNLNTANVDIEPNLNVSDHSSETSEFTTDSIIESTDKFQSTESADPGTQSTPVIPTSIEQNIYPDFHISSQLTFPAVTVTESILEEMSPLIPTPITGSSLYSPTTENLIELPLEQNLFSVLNTTSFHIPTVSKTTTISQTDNENYSTENTGIQVTNAPVLKMNDTLLSISTNNPRSEESVVFLETTEKTDYVSTSLQSTTNNSGTDFDSTFPDSKGDQITFLEELDAVKREEELKEILLLSQLFAAPSEEPITTKVDEKIDVRFGGLESPLSEFDYSDGSHIHKELKSMNNFTTENDTTNQTEDSNTTDHEQISSVAINKTNNLPYSESQTISTEGITNVNTTSSCYDSINKSGIVWNNDQFESKRADSYTTQTINQKELITRVIRSLNNNLTNKWILTDNTKHRPTTGIDSIAGYIQNRTESNLSNSNLTNNWMLPNNTEHATTDINSIPHNIENKTESNILNSNLTNNWILPNQTEYRPTDMNSIPHYIENKTVSNIFNSNLTNNWILPNQTVYRPTDMNSIPHYIENKTESNLFISSLTNNWILPNNTEYRPTDMNSIPHYIENKTESNLSTSFKKNNQTNITKQEEMDYDLTTSLNNNYFPVISMHNVPVDAILGVDQNPLGGDGKQLPTSTANYQLNVKNASDGSTPITAEDKVTGTLKVDDNNATTPIYTKKVNSDSNVTIKSSNKLREENSTLSLPSQLLKQENNSSEGFEKFRSIEFSNTNVENYTNLFQLNKVILHSRMMIGDGPKESENSQYPTGIAELFKVIREGYSRNAFSVEELQAIRDLLQDLLILFGDETRYLRLIGSTKSVNDKHKNIATNKSLEKNSSAQDQIKVLRKRDVKSNKRRSHKVRRSHHKDQAGFGSDIVRTTNATEAAAILALLNEDHGHYQQDGPSSGEDIYYYDERDGYEENYYDEENHSQMANDEEYYDNSEEASFGELISLARKHRSRKQRLQEFSRHGGKTKTPAKPTEPLNIQ